RGVVEFAREHGCLVVHDLAYADLCFDGYVAPSFLQVPGAKDVGVEFFTLSKSYNMPGWRVGFAVGNAEIIGALARIKSYLGYGEYGDHYVRFALIENEHRTRQAVRGIRRALGAGLVQKLPHAGTG